MARTPVQIIVARDHGDPKTEPFVDALRLAFEGAAHLVRESLDLIHDCSRTKCSASYWREMQIVEVETKVGAR